MHLHRSLGRETGVGCRRLLLVIGAIGAMLAFSGAASAADGITPMATVGASPVNGTSIPSSEWEPFEVDVSGLLATQGDATMYVDIATQNVTGPDGTLGFAFSVDYFALTQSYTTPTAYRGHANTYSDLAPGTYYWQAQVFYLDETVPGWQALDQVSPVFSFVVPGPGVVSAPVATPTAPPTVVVPLAPSTTVTPPSSVPARPHRMTLADLAYDLPATISQNDHSARKISHACTRISNQIFSCRTSWQDRANVFAGTLRVIDTGDFRSSFVGARASFACLGAHSVAACARPFSWKN